ncbi:MAG: sigma-70 family RNA polymerase sigma factor [Myxococcales bacterium]|nr:sigma-70 family RNA polymerase sigma factor [Myxococcales bacterium]
MLTATPAFATPSSEEISRHLPLVRQVVAGFVRRLPVNVLRDDLVAAGILGLVDSLRKNGGDGGPTFESYARIRIRGAILDELRSQDWLPRRARWAAEGKTDRVATVVAVVGLDDASGELPFADDAPHAEALLAEQDEARELAAVVEQLPPRERLIVQMHYFQGARFKDIGEALGVSEPRVSQLHTRAMSQLRKLLAA